MNNSNEKGWRDWSLGRKIAIILAIIIAVSLMLMLMTLDFYDLLGVYSFVIQFIFGALWLIFALVQWRKTPKYAKFCLGLSVAYFLLSALKLVGGILTASS